MLYTDLQISILNHKRSRLKWCDLDFSRAAEPEPVGAGPFFIRAGAGKEDPAPALALFKHYFLLNMDILTYGHIDICTY